MKNRNSWLVGIVFACLLVLPTPVSADDSADPSQLGFQYAAKFLCTANIPGTSQTTASVVPGNYETVISIHNPQNQPVRFHKKIALTFSGVEQPGPVSKFVPETLKADEASQVDCTVIANDFGITFIHGAEGFLVIESTLSLDVNAVLTAAKNGDQGGEVESIAVEQVRERRLKQND
jgi:hypothetical protein